MSTKKTSNLVIVTAGSTYIDIDAYACSVALAELINLQGGHAVAYSKAPCNYSVCESLIEDSLMLRTFPENFGEVGAEYIIVDVSDPDYIKDAVPLNQVGAVYDHHVGFEEYWEGRIGENSHIEFIGAAATLIYREWKNACLKDKMSRTSALLLIAAILDNTLNLTSANTTPEDIAAFNEICEKENIGEDWCASYFSEVQTSVEADLKNALFGDMKTNRDNDVLPTKIAQLCVWDAEHVLVQLPEIRQWFRELQDSWMINIIDIKQRCSYFVCDETCHQMAIEKIFDIRFEAGVAKTPTSYLRKEIIKKANYNN